MRSGIKYGVRQWPFFGQFSESVSRPPPPHDRGVSQSHLLSDVLPDADDDQSALQNNNYSFAITGMNGSRLLRVSASATRQRYDFVQ